MTRLILLIAFVVATSPGAVRTSHSAGEDSGRFPEVPHRTSQGTAEAGDTTLTTEAVSATGGSAAVPSTTAPTPPVYLGSGQSTLAGGASASVAPATSIPAQAPKRRATATWCAPTPRYCAGWDTAFVGARWSFRWGDRPYAVRVCEADSRVNGGCVVVRVVSFCACKDRRGIDLSLPAWRSLFGLTWTSPKALQDAAFGLGRIDVTIRRVPTLPATDVEER